MNAGFKPIVIVLVAMGLLGISIPTDAQSQALKLGVLAQGLDLSPKDLAPGVSLHGLSLDKLSPETLNRLDGIILGPAEARAIADDPASLATLRDFLMSGHPIFFAGEGAALLGPLGAPVLGGDLAVVNGATAPADASLSGIFVNPDGSVDTIVYAFNSLEDVPTKSAAKASRMLADHGQSQLKGGKPDSGMATLATTGNGYWSTHGTASYCTDRYPYGSVCYSAYFMRLENDASSTYDWWNVVMHTSATPGYVNWGNPWFTNKVWTTSDVDGYRIDNKLVDYGPSSAYNLPTVSYSIGVTDGVNGGMENNEQTYSYDLPYVYAAQGSSPTYNDFTIRHEIDYASALTASTYTTKAGFTVRVPQGGSLKIPYTNKAEFWDYSTNSFASVYINSWREIF